MQTSEADLESAPPDAVGRSRLKPPPMDLRRCWNEVEESSGYAVLGAVTAEADISALTAINAQLGNAKTLVGLAFATLTRISNALIEARTLLQQIGRETLSRGERAFYVSCYTKLVCQVANMIDSSSSKGQSLLGSASGRVWGKTRSIIYDENGSTRVVSTGDCSGLPDSLARLIGSSFARSSAGLDSFGEIAAGSDQDSAQRALSEQTGVGGFAAIQAGVAAQLSRAAAELRFLDETIAHNTVRVETLKGGLGMLTDTDAREEATRLLALQIGQQLKDPSRPSAEEAPKTLLSLFA